MLSPKTVDAIRHFDGGGLPVLSLYLRRGVDRRDARALPARLKDLLHPVRELADSGRLERAASLSLRSDAEGILALSGELERATGRGIGIFSCSGRGFLERVVLPRPVRDRCVVDATPYVRPMMAVLDEYHRYCALVVERRRSVIFEFHLGELLEIEEHVEEGVRKRNFGGWHGYEEKHARGHAAWHAHRHYRETAKMAIDLLQRRSFDLLLVGGHEETVAEFLPFLHPYLRERLAGTFVIDLHTLTPAAVREQCSRLEQAWEREQERRLVAELLETAGAGGNAVLGLARTLDAANVAGIRLLLVHDGWSAPGFRCDACGWLGTGPPRCPGCSQPARETPDVVDELVEDAIDEGARIEHVGAQTELARHGVGALTRFPIPELGSGGG